MLKTIDSYPNNIYMKKCLVVFFAVVIFKTNAQESIVGLSQYPTLDKLLEQKWTYEFEKSDLSMYSQWPIVENGVLFAHFDMSYVVDLDSGNKWYFVDTQYRKNITSKIKDSLLVYDLLDKVVIKNIFSGEIYTTIRKRSERGGYTGYEAPYFLKSSQIYYKEDDKTVLSFNVVNREKTWAFSTDEDIVVNQPIMYEQKVIFCSESSMYFLNKESGKLLVKITLADGIMKGSNINSSINIYDNIAYVWTEKNGLVAIDADEQEVVWKSINEGKTVRATITALFDKDTLFTSFPNFIASIDRNTGELLWKSDGQKIGIPYKMALHPHYIFYYTKNRELDADLLCAFNRASKKTEYVGFTSKKFPPPTLGDQSHQKHLDDQDEVHIDNLQLPQLNELDERALSLIKYTHGNLLVGTVGNKIYCFEIRAIPE